MITFLQFAFISVIALPVPLFTAGSQNNGKGSVPMTRWAYIAFLFYSINMLNNWAFAFNISVPVHIILRSFGSVTTMLAGVGPVPVAMVVVAADDPWMPQATEHLAALDALDVRHGLLVVTRADLADPAAPAALFADTPEGAFSLNLLFDRAIRSGRLFGMRLDGQWLHVGTPEAIGRLST